MTDSSKQRSVCFKTKFGKEPKVYPVTISDGARKLN